MTPDEAQSANTSFSYVPRYGSASYLESLALGSMLIELRDVHNSVCTILDEPGPRADNPLIRTRYLAAREAVEAAINAGAEVRVVGLAVELALDAADAYLTSFPARRVA